MFTQEILVIALLCVSIATSDTNPNITQKGSSVNLSQNPSVIDSKSKKLPSVPLNLTKNEPKVPGQVATEGGAVTSNIGMHTGREHVIEPPITKTVNSKALPIHNVVLTKPNNIKPVKEPVINDLENAPQSDDEKPSVPKKGVSFSDLSPQLNDSSPNANNIVKTGNNYVNATSISNQNMTKPVITHKKPLQTESDDDYTNNESQKDAKENTLTVDQLDPMLLSKKSKRSDYIVPIVAVILSVPLVAILISLLYKRGTDWWQHRNYKRMDFLIEGMYHN